VSCRVSLAESIEHDRQVEFRPGDSCRILVGRPILNGQRRPQQRFGLGVGPDITQDSGQREHGVERRRIGLSVQLLPGIENEPGLLDLLGLVAVHAPPTIVPSRWEIRCPARGYRVVVTSPRIPGGVVHKLPGDLRSALIGNQTALVAWKDITPLARNEFICWVEDAKQEKTRERRIRRTQEELEDGMRRPCCWPGCTHRERTGR
jgi:hypothetical protein